MNNKLLMTRRRTARRLIATTATATFVMAGVAGCSGSTGGDASPTSPSVQITGPAGTATVPASENPIQQAELWDPCSLPAEVRKSINLADDTRNDDSIPPWRTCSYDTGTGTGPGDPSYAVNVQVSTYSFEEMKHNSSYLSNSPTTVGKDHPAFFAEDKGDSVGSNKPGVNIVWGTTFGSVAVNLIPLGGSAPIDENALIRTFVDSAYSHIPD